MQLVVRAITVLWLLSSLIKRIIASDVTVVLSPSASSTHSVKSNFLGISIELSFLDQYTGSSPNALITPVVNYFANLRPTDGNPLRIRVGGNSMDSATFVPDQTEFIIFTNPNANINDVQSSIGPILFDTLNAYGKAIGGASYMIGVSLRDPSSANGPLLAAHAHDTLGSTLDALLLGNEPDLYTAHNNRPNLTNYTTADYFQDFTTVQTLLENTSSGNLLQKPVLGSPNICCQWDLDSLISDGYLSRFSSTLKYITLQHYPQNNCNNTHAFSKDYYLQHNNVVGLASWQIGGIKTSITDSQSVLMTEFNSASCGGVPGESDTFAASLWTVDYSLQMASVGFSAAYLHTREANVTYTLFYPSGNNYITRSSYYALLPINAALTPNKGSPGSIVVDLNLNQSSTTNSSAAGYAIYDTDSSGASGGSASRLVLFNYDLSRPVTFNLNGSSFGSASTSPKTVSVSYLVAPTVTEAYNISWAGSQVGPDGKLAQVATAASNITVQCASTCDVSVPGPGLAVVWLTTATPVNLKGAAHRSVMLKDGLVMILACVALSTLMVDFTR